MRAVLYYGLLLTGGVRWGEALCSLNTALSGCGLTAGLALLAVYLVLPYTVPFLFAALLAAIIDRPVDYLERRTRWPRGFIVALVLFAVVLGVTGLLAFLIANVVRELEVFYRALPDYADRWRSLTESLSNDVRTLSARLPDPVAAFLAGAVEDLTELLSGAASGLLAQVKHLPGLFTSLFIAAFTTFFLSRDKRGLAAAWMRHLPPAWHERLFRLKRQIAAGSLGLVRGQVILACCTFALSTAAFSAFRLSYAWLLGIVAALFDLTPMVGRRRLCWSSCLLLFRTHRSCRRACRRAASLLRQILSPGDGAELGVHP